MVTTVRMWRIDYITLCKGFNGKLGKANNIDVRLDNNNKRKEKGFVMDGPYSALSPGSILAQGPALVLGSPCQPPRQLRALLRTEEMSEEATCLDRPTWLTATSEQASCKVQHAQPRWRKCMQTQQQGEGKGESGGLGGQGMAPEMERLLCSSDSQGDSRKTCPGGQDVQTHVTGQTVSPTGHMGG